MSETEKMKKAAEHRQPTTDPAEATLNTLQQQKLSSGAAARQFGMSAPAPTPTPNLKATNNDSSDDTRQAMKKLSAEKDSRPALSPDSDSHQMKSINSALSKAGDAVKTARKNLKDMTNANQAQAPSTPSVNRGRSRSM